MRLGSRILTLFKANLGRLSHKSKLGGMLRKGMPWSSTPTGVSLRSASCLPQGLQTAAHALLHNQGIGRVGLVALGKQRVLGPQGETQKEVGIEKRRKNGLAWWATELPVLALG